MSWWEKGLFFNPAVGLHDCRRFHERPIHDHSGDHPDDNGAAAGHLTLVGGTKTLSSFTFHTAGTRTITATHTSGTLTANASGNITVNAGAFTKLQLLVPGETAVPGVTPGKTGTPNTQTTGNAFSVTVNAVDADWNRVSTVTDLVGITSSDGSATLPASANLAAGTMTFGVTLNVIAGTATITASDIFDGLKSPDTSPTITVNSSPNITSQPSSQTVCSGSSANFTVSASGGALSYQWRKDTVAISGATNSTYTIDSVSAADVGSYDVVVNNACALPVTSNAATLAVTAPPSTTSPSSQTRCPGDSVSFSVMATGDGLTYQWRKDAVNIPGATASTLTIDPVGSGDAGSYDVVVSGTCSPAVTSNAATLTVTFPVTIATPPVAQTVCLNDAASFSVIASGTGPFTYQWRKNNLDLADSSNVSGATTSVLTINPVNATDAGTYTVSSFEITQQPADQTLLADCSTSVSFTAAATGTPAPTVLWQVSTTGGRTWANLSGKTNSTLTLTGVTPAQNGYKHRALFKSACSIAYSSAAILTAAKVPTTSNYTRDDPDNDRVVNVRHR